MRIFLLIILGVLASQDMRAQDRYLTRQGYISFFSHTPVEDIKAENHQVLSVIDLATGEVAVSLLMKSFQFEKALMQEHFNENYIESDKYPKSTFKGNIMNLEEILNGDNGIAEVKGDLTIHGITRPVNIEGKLDISGGVVHFEGTFPVIVADYDIKIPSIVARNIAREVEVTCILEHHPY